MADKEAHFYQKLRKRITTWLNKDGAENKWSKYIMWAPDMFYLLWKLSTDPDVPKPERVKLVAAIAYFISPIDFFPEAVLGPFGFADDIIVAALVLNSLINNTAPDVVEKHWPGDEDVLEVIKKIINISDQLVGQKVLKKIRSIIK